MRWSVVADNAHHAFAHILPRQPAGHHITAERFRDADHTDMGEIRTELFTNPKTLCTSCGLFISLHNTGTTALIVALSTLVRRARVAASVCWMIASRITELVQARCAGWVCGEDVVIMDDMRDMGAAREMIEEYV